MTALTLHSLSPILFFTPFTIFSAFRGQMTNKISATLLVCAISVFAAFYIFIPCISINAPDLLYPTIFYTALFLIESWIVLARLGEPLSGDNSNINYISRCCAVVGVLTFLVSDMIIIIAMTCQNKTHHEQDDYDLAIMATYYAGQFLISLGSMEAFSGNTGAIRTKSD